MIFINFKTYKEASGDKAIRLAKVANEIKKSSGVEIVCCPQAVDLWEVVKTTKSAWAQHVDAKKRGRATGWTPAEVMQESGAQGTLLNHSEHKISVGQLGETLVKCKEIGLKTLVFADSPEEARAVSQFNPNYIGYEPPELIASTDTSVAKAKPDVVRNVVKSLPNSKIIVGAGVKDKNDVKVSLELGAAGIALASAVVLAEDPGKVLADLAEGFNS